MKIRLTVESFNDCFVTTFFSSRNFSARDRGIFVSDLNYSLRAIGYDCMWWNATIEYISTEGLLLKEVYIDRNTLKSYIPNFQNIHSGALRRLQSCIGQQEMLRLILYFLKNNAEPNVQKILKELGVKNDLATYASWNM